MPTYMTNTYYAVLISRDPNSGYQFYAGWDQIFTSHTEAERLLGQAKAKFCGAKITSATEDEARRLGWLANPTARKGELKCLNLYHSRTIWPRSGPSSPRSVPPHPGRTESSAAGLPRGGLNR